MGDVEAALRRVPSFSNAYCITCRMTSSEHPYTEPCRAPSPGSSDAIQRTSPDSAARTVSSTSSAQDRINGVRTKPRASLRNCPAFAATNRRDVKKPGLLQSSLSPKRCRGSVRGLVLDGPRWWPSSTPSPLPAAPNSHRCRRSRRSKRSRTRIPSRSAPTATD